MDMLLNFIFKRALNFKQLACKLALFRECTRLRVVHILLLVVLVLLRMWHKFVAVVVKICRMLIMYKPHVYMHAHG